MGNPLTKTSSNITQSQTGMAIEKPDYLRY